MIPTPTTNPPVNGSINEDVIVESMGLQLIRGLFDATDNLKTFYEIKSCCARVRRGKSTRNGRFQLNRYQHEFLVQHNGIYIFVVVFEDGRRLIRFVPAKDLKYSPTIYWTTIFYKI